MRERPLPLWVKAARENHTGKTIMGLFTAEEGEIHLEKVSRYPEKERFF